MGGSRPPLPSLDDLNKSSEKDDQSVPGSCHAQL